MKDNFQSLLLYPVERFSYDVFLLCHEFHPYPGVGSSYKHLIMATAFSHCSSSADSLEPWQLGLSIPVGREI